MKIIKINNASDLNIILETNIFLSKKNNQELETYKNMWAVMLQPNAKNKLTLSDLESFFTQLIKNRKNQIKNVSIKPTTFYIWHDNQIEQLCFNIISSDKNNLPFGCKVHFEDSLDIILKEFLQTNHHGGVFPIDKIIISEDENSIDDEDFILNVFQISF